MGKCANFVTRKYGFPIRAVENVVVLNALAAVPVMQANPDRVGWVIFNLGGAIGYIGLTTAVGALNGSQLAVLGGAATANAADEGEYTTYEQYGLGAGATTLYVLEFIGM